MQKEEGHKFWYNALLEDGAGKIVSSALNGGKSHQKFSIKTTNNVVFMLVVSQCHKDFVYEETIFPDASFRIAVSVLSHTSLLLYRSVDVSFPWPE